MATVHLDLTTNVDSRSGLSVLLPSSAVRTPGWYVGVVVIGGPPPASPLPLGIVRFDQIADSGGADLTNLGTGGAAFTMVWDSVGVGFDNYLATNDPGGPTGSPYPSLADWGGDFCTTPWLISCIAPAGNFQVDLQALWGDSWSFFDAFSGGYINFHAIHTSGFGGGVTLSGQLHDYPDGPVTTPEIIVFVDESLLGATRVVRLEIDWSTMTPRVSIEGVVYDVGTAPAGVTFTINGASPCPTTTYLGGGGRLTITADAADGAETGNFDIARGTL